MGTREHTIHCAAFVIEVVMKLQNCLYSHLRPNKAFCKRKHCNCAKLHPGVFVTWQNNAESNPQNVSLYWQSF